MTSRVLLPVVCLALVGGAAAWRFRPGSGSPGTGAPAAVPAAATRPGLNTFREPGAVFQRAFWRKPDATVRILEAERREWADERTSVQRWQWFLALESRPEFRRWLLEENPFGLVPLAEVPDRIAGAPDWFPPADQLRRLTSYRVPGAGFRVYLEPASGRLFATDSGGGFATAAR